MPHSMSYYRNWHWVGYQCFNVHIMTPTAADFKLFSDSSVSVSQSLLQFTENNLISLNAFIYLFLSL